MRKSSMSAGFNTSFVVVPATHERYLWDGAVRRESRRRERVIRTAQPRLMRNLYDGGWLDFISVSSFSPFELTSFFLLWLGCFPNIDSPPYRRWLHILPPIFLSVWFPLFRVSYPKTQCRRGWSRRCVSQGVKAWLGTSEADTDMAARTALA